MSSVNKFINFITNKGKPPIGSFKPIDELRRTVMSCLLWEDEFYEDGVSIAERIESLVQLVEASDALQIAIEAKESGKLRHVPLLILSSLWKSKIDIQQASRLVTRVDDMGEIIALYRLSGNHSLPAAMKRLLRLCFDKFDAYQFAKYNRGGFTPRDIMRMVHPKAGEGKEELYKQIATDTLPTPDTWEVALSSGADKKETFTRLLQEKKLGYLALLRNLRNMEQSGVDAHLIREALLEGKGARQMLPFRYIAAARNAVTFEAELDIMMLKAIEHLPLLEGTTAVLVDVSGSMNAKLSQKSDINRIDAAAALGAMINAQKLQLYSFSNNLKQVPSRKGMAGVDAIVNSQPHNSTNLASSLEELNAKTSYDRLIIITDEQVTDDAIPNAKCKKAYLINIASNKKGINYGNYTRINGFSENIFTYIHEYEQP